MNYYILGKNLKIYHEKNKYLCFNFKYNINKKL